MKKSFFLLLFGCLASVMVGQSVTPPYSAAVHADMDNYVVFSVPDKSATYHYIFDGSLNLEVFEREVQIRYQVYEIAAESAIAGDAETEGMAWFIVERMKDPDFMNWYNSTFPAMLEILSIPESTSVEDIGVAEKAQRLKKRLFPDRE